MITIKTVEFSSNNFGTYSFTEKKQLLTDKPDPGKKFQPQVLLKTELCFKIFLFQDITY